MLDYAKPLDPDLQLRDFATPVLRAFDEEACLQGHLLAISFMAAVEDRVRHREGGRRRLPAAHGGRRGRGGPAQAGATGSAPTPSDVATVFALHPAFRPAAYVSWQVTLDGDVVRLELGDCPARQETGLETWMSLLADGHDRALSAIAAAVDPHWHVTDRRPVPLGGAAGRGGGRRARRGHPRQVLHRRRLRLRPMKGTS